MNVEASPALQRALETIRQAGIREARAAHADRVKLVEKYKACPEAFFALIRPSLSTQEAIEDATREIAMIRRMPTWRRVNRQQQLVAAKRKRWLARYFRRFGQRIWLPAEAA